jgi:hypothetical protein
MMLASKMSDPAVPTDNWTNPTAAGRAARASAARQKSNRRRLVDPATCDRQYSVAEMEFLAAIQDYKARSGRQFPTWSEVLEVVQSLGYVKAGEEVAR